MPCLKSIRYGPRPGFSLALGPLIVSHSISMSVKLESPYRLWPKRPRAESTRYKYIGRDEPPRPNDTPKIGRNDPGRNDPAKRLWAEMTRIRNFDTRILRQ